MRGFDCPNLALSALLSLKLGLVYNRNYHYALELFFFSKDFTSFSHMIFNFAWGAVRYLAFVALVNMILSPHICNVAVGCWTTADYWCAVWKIDVVVFLMFFKVSRWYKLANSCEGEFSFASTWTLNTNYLVWNLVIHVFLQADSVEKMVQVEFIERNQFTTNVIGELFANFAFRRILICLEHTQVFFLKFLNQSLSFFFLFILQ